MRLMLRLKLMGGCWGRQMQNDERAAACWVCYVCDDFGGNEGAVVFQAVGKEATLGRSESCHCEPQRNSCGCTWPWNVPHTHIPMLKVACYAVVCPVDQRA